MDTHSTPFYVTDRWVFIGLLTLLVWAPMPLGSNRTWAIGVLLLCAMGLLVAVSIAWRHQFSAAWNHLTPFAWPIGLLGAMVAFTWAQTMPLPSGLVQIISPMSAQIQAPADWMTLSLDVFQTRIAASLAFVYWSMFVVTLLTVRTAERLERLCMVLVASGVVQAVVGTVLFSMKAEYRIFFSNVSHTRMIGTFVYHNNMAGYMCMCLSIGVGLMLARLGSKKVVYPNWRARAVAIFTFVLSDKMRLRMMLIVLVIALVLTRSRMGNAAFFTAMLVVGLWAMVVARKTAPKTVALIASLIIVDVLVVGTWVGLEKVVERIQETEMRVADGGLSESVEARTEAARASLSIVKDFPLVGTGGGSFYGVFLSYHSAQYGSVYFDHTHNDFVEIASDYGLVGLGLLGSLVALTLWRVLRVMATRRSNIPWGVAFGVAMAIVGLLVHSAVDFNLQIPSNAMTITVLLAMGWIAHTLPSGRGRRSTRSKDLDVIA
jgi:O-antigen ligase